MCVFKTKSHSPPCISK